MFNDTLYHILHHESIDAFHSRFTLSFNPAHPIFAAHFPGRPMLPGVCSVEIIRELLSSMLGGSCRITDIKNLKFTEIIIPHPELRCLFDIAVALEGDAGVVKATITSEDASKCYTKLSMQISKHAL